jgi:hypothetical protein
VSAFDFILRVFIIIGSPRLYKVLEIKVVSRDERAEGCVEMGIPKCACGVTTGGMCTISIWGSG